MAVLHVKTPNGTQKDIDIDSIITDVKTGSANGTLSVNGTDVAVKGLGSAAYTASTAYTPIAKSIGGTQRPVYTDSDGVITACTETGSVGGLEGVNSLSMSNESYYIRFESGLQICWLCTQMTNSGYQWTFPVPFIARPNMQITTVYNGTFGDNMSIRMIAWEKETTGTYAMIVSNTDSPNDKYKFALAIGWWKNKEEEIS